MKHFDDNDVIQRALLNDRVEEIKGGLVYQLLSVLFYVFLGLAVVVFMVGVVK